jgi:type I restriction enzyme S subunit
MNKISLKEVSELITKGTTPSSVGCEYTAEGINFIKSESISDSKFLNNNVYEHINEITDDKLKRSRLNAGDLLVSIAGAYLGKIAIVQVSDIPANTNQAVGIVRLNQKLVNIDYVYYYFSQKHVNSYINKLSAQSSQPNLNLDLLGKLEFDIKNLSTQEKIASVLSALDSKIELNNRINAELELMAKTLYDYWFVQFDFPDKNGKPFKTNGGKMVWNEELKREIPEGWASGVLSDLGEVLGGSTPSRDVDENFDKNGTPWITPKDLSENTGNKFITKGEVSVSDKGLKSASLKILPKGSVLMSSRAPVGYMAIARAAVTTNQGFKSFVPKSDYSTSFIFYTIKNAMPEIINNASGSTFKEISGSTLKIIKVCLPKNDVIKEFTIKVHAIFDRQNNLEIENQKLTELRDWLLPMLMNGQVRVN